MTDTTTPIFLGVGDKSIWTSEELDRQKRYNAIFSRYIVNVFSKLNEVLSGRRVNIRTCIQGEYCFTHIVGFNDYTLIELGKEYGFPRGVCFVWKHTPKSAFTFVNVLDFVPKFGNEVDNKKDMCDLYSTNYFMKKLSGSLIYIKAISPIELIISAKNSMFNEFTNRFFQVMGHLFTLKFVNDLYQRNWTIGFEFIADRLGGDHASRSSIDTAVAIVVTLNRVDLANFCTDKEGLSTVISWEETAQLFDQHNIPYLRRYYVSPGSEWNNWVDNVLIPNRDFFTNSVLSTELNRMIENGIVRVVGGNYDHAHSDVLEGLIVVLENGHRFKFKFARYTLMTMAIRVAISKQIINSGHIHLPEWIELVDSYTAYWTPSNQSFFKSLLHHFAIEIINSPIKIEESTYLDVCEPIVTKLWELAKNGLTDGLTELKQFAPELIVYPVTLSQSPTPSIPYVDKIPKSLPPSVMAVNGGRVLRWAALHGYRVDWSYWDDKCKQATKMKHSLQQILKEAQKELDNQIPINCHIILMSALPGSGKSYLLKNLIKLWNRKETLVVVDGDSIKSLSSGTQSTNMFVKDNGVISQCTMCIKDLKYPNIVMFIDKNTPNVDDTARSWKKSKELKHWNIRVSNLRMANLKNFRSYRYFLLSQMRNRPNHSVAVNKVEEVLDLFYSLYESGSETSFRSKEYATTVVENDIIRFKTQNELEDEINELWPFFDWPEKDQYQMMQARFKVMTDLEVFGWKIHDPHVTIYWGSTSDKPNNLDNYKERNQLTMTHLYDLDGFVVLYTLDERQPASGTLFHVTIKYPHNRRPVDAGLTVTKLKEHDMFKLETPFILNVKYCELTT